jgi:hypothetical protein
VVLWARQGKLGDRSALGQGEGRRAAAAVARVQRVDPIQVAVVEHVADPVGLVKVTWAIWPTSMPCADSSTIWARRQVTTDPVDRRTIRSSRLPSSLLISRTRTRLPPKAPPDDPMSPGVSTRMPPSARPAISTKQGQRCRPRH